MEFKREELVQFTIDSLNDLKGYYKGYGSDLHAEIFNTDYYIIGTYQAKEWCNTEVFNIIEEIKTYETDNFGECITDISNPEKVVNMFVYIQGEKILALSDYLQVECFDRHLSEADIEIIIKEIMA